MTAGRPATGPVLVLIAVAAAGSCSSPERPPAVPLDPERAAAFATWPESSGRVIRATYIGGSRTDSIRDVAFDAAGNLYLAGGTDSDDFPLADASGAFLSWSRQTAAWSRLCSA